MAIKKKSKGSSLKDRMKKSYESKDKGGGNRPQAFNWNKVKNIKFFKPTEGKKNVINIIPYKIGSENDPLVASGDFKVGDLSYMLDVFVHTYVGPTQAEVICPKENFNKPCPICEQAKHYWDEGKKKEAKALKAKRFCLYNIQDIKNPSDLQLWFVKHFLFEKELVDEARNSSEDGEMVDFSDPDDGKSISFRWAEENTVIEGKSTDYFKAKSISFPDREEAIDSDLIDKAISLDGLMKIQSYKEIEKLLVLEDDSESDDEEEKPKKSSKKKVEDDDDEEKDEEESDDDDEEEEDEEEEDDESVEEEESDDDDEDDEIEDPVEDEEEEKPKKSSKKEPKKDAKKSSKTKAVPGKCPSDLKFGADCDKYDVCEDCDNWDSCLKKQNELKKKKK